MRAGPITAFTNSENPMGIDWAYLPCDEAFQDGKIVACHDCQGSALSLCQTWLSIFFLSLHRRLLEFAGIRLPVHSFI
jgi:hypothetical protein